MKYIILLWLAVISVITITLMFQVMDWSDRIVEQAGINANQQEDIVNLKILNQNL